MVIDPGWKKHKSFVVFIKMLTDALSHHSYTVYANTIYDLMFVDRAAHALLSVSDLYFYSHIIHSEHLWS